MKHNFNYHFIKTLHRKLGLPRNFVYFTSSIISNFFACNIHEKNKINSFSKISSNNLIPHDRGYKQFKPDETNELDEIVSICQSIFDQNKNKYNEEFFIKNPNKRFLLTIDSDENLLKYNQLKNFFTSDFVNNAIYAYLKHSYVLSTIRLWWTPVNKTSVSSQMFHLDDEDLTQIKLFINISDVSHDHGPFTLLPNNSSSKILSRYKNGKRRYTDDEVYQYIDQSDQISLTGPAGSGAFVDTSKCLHYGSRGNCKDRLILMAQFLKTNAPLITKSIQI